MPIPKIIHQTWKTDQVPEQWQSSVQKYRDLEEKGFKYMLWTDADNRNLIQQDFPWFLEQFDSYPYGIQRADAIRYFILYKYGGVYSDLDIQPKDNFPAFFDMYKDYELCLPSTKSGNGFAGQNFSNCFMMSAPGCDFWPLVWERLKDPFKGRWWKKVLAEFHYFKILFTTGPGVISDTAVEYKKPIVALPSQLIQPGVEKDPPPVQRPESAVELLRGESWQQGDANFWRTLGEVGNNGFYIVLAFMVTFFVLMVAGFYMWRRTKKQCHQKQLELCTQYKGLKECQLAVG